MSKATQRLVTRDNDPRFIIDMGPEGTARRVIQRVRLHYGADLYCIKRSPSNDDRANIWASGCAKVVQAMGGRLEPLVTSVDPGTGQRVAGTRVIRDESSGVIKRIEADAVCAVRNPNNGEWAVAVATAVEDIDLMRLRELDKLTGNHDSEVATMITDEQVGAYRAKAGWVVFAYSPGIWLAANLNKQAVREAIVKHRQFADEKVLMPRIRSKALRHAYLANPITRAVSSIDYGLLDHEPQPPGPPCWDIEVPCWVAYEHRSDLDRVIATLVEKGGYSAVPIDLVRDEPLALDADPDEQRLLAAPEEDIAPAPDLDAQPVRRDEPIEEVLPAAPEEQDAPDERPAKSQLTLTGGPSDDEVDADRERLLAAILEWEETVHADIVEVARESSDVPLDLPSEDLGTLGVETLRAYLAELKR